MAVTLSDNNLSFKHSKLFNGYLLIIVLSPLPFASNRLWAWALLASLTFFLLAAYFFTCYKSQKAPLEQINKSSLIQLKLFILLTIWIALSSAFSLNINTSDIIVSTLKSLFFISFFLLGIISIKTLQDAKRVMLVIVLSAIFQSAYGAFMTLSGIELSFFSHKTSYIGKATGTFINRNHFAGYLELSLAIAIGLMMSTETKFSGTIREKIRKLIKLILSEKALIRLGIIVMVIALVLSRSRMGNTAFFTGLLVAGTLSLLLMRKKSKSLIILLTSLIIFDVAIMSTFFGIKQVAERIQKTSPKYETRDEVAKDAINMILDKPVLGHGIGTFKYTYPNYRSESVYNLRIYDHVHNDYLEFLVELGFPGFLLLVAITLISLKNSIVSLRKPRSRLSKSMAFSCLMGITVIAVHSTVDFNLQIPANALLFIIILTLGNLSGHLKNRKRRKSH